MSCLILCFACDEDHRQRQDRRPPNCSCVRSVLELLHFHFHMDQDPGLGTGL